MTTCMACVAAGLMQPIWVLAGGHGGQIAGRDRGQVMADVTGQGNVRIQGQRKVGAGHGPQE